MAEVTARPPHAAVMKVEAALKDELVSLMSISAYIRIAGTEKLLNIIKVISFGLAQHSSEVEAITYVMRPVPVHRIVKSVLELYMHGHLNGYPQWSGFVNLV